jgi:uncharacterized BrkB/YihY/UPF0761 family membrane protein
MYLQGALWIIGVGLQILVITSLLRGAHKRFPFVLAYSMTLFLTTVVEIASMIDKGGFTAKAANFYWINDLILTSLVYCVVISLIYSSLSPDRRARIGRWLIVGAALVALISATAHRDDVYRSLERTKLSRDLNFTAAGLDMLLWLILLASRKRERELLMVSGGLGIQFTGAAIGHSLRQLSQNWPSAVFAGGLIVVITHFMCLYVWWEAFRKATDRRNSAAVTARKPG